MSNEPIAFFFTPDGKIILHKIQARGTKFFVKNNKNVKGIYTLNNKYRKTMGKTSCYFYATQETNNIDPVLVDKLNKWKSKNGLTEVKRKDVKHGSKLRTLFKQKEKKQEIIENLKKEESEKANEIKSEVNMVDQQISQRLDQLKQQHNKEINTTNAEKGFMLLAHLKEIGKIDQVEFDKYLDKVEKNTYTFDMLLDDMREKHDVQVSEPLDINVEDFIQDLGAQSAPELAGFCQDIIKAKRGLKDLTPAPVKAFMPAGILLALIIGGMIAAVLGFQYLGSGSGIPSSESIGIKMPWEMFGGQFLAALKFW